MPNLSYFRDIPDADNNPSDDQPDMKTNTNSIDTLINVDHYSFKQNKGGSHKQVTLTNSAAPGLGEGTGVLYAKLFNGNSWPVWQNALGSTLMLGSLTSAATNGYVSLPGEILIQWGQIDGTHDANFHFKNLDTDTVTFATLNKNFLTNCFAVFLMPAFTGGSPPVKEANFVVSSSLATTSFSWKFLSESDSKSYTRFYWLAIGK